MSEKVKRDEPVISKFVKNISILEDDDIDINQDTNIDVQNSYDDMKDYDDMIESYYFIHKHLIDYVNDKNLTLCEYMTFDKLKSFIDKEF